MQQSSRNSPPRLPTRKHETPRVVSVVEIHAGAFDMDETGAGRLRTFWYRFSYQKVNQTCTTWWQILYQIGELGEQKRTKRAARPFSSYKKGGRPAKETTANLQNANGAPAVPISPKMKSGAKVTRNRQKAKGVSRIVEAFIRSSPKGGAPQTQGEQTAARYGSPRRRRHAPKQKAPPRRVELAKAHPLNGGYLERHALRARILNAPARIVTQFTPYIHPLQGWRSYTFFSVCFLSISSKSDG